MPDDEISPEMVEKILGGLDMDPDKARALLDGQHTLLAENAYHEFLRVYSRLSHPLNSLVRHIGMDEDRISRERTRLKATANPYWDDSFTDMVNMHEYSSLRFMQELVGQVRGDFDAIYHNTLIIPRIHSFIDNLTRSGDKATINAVQQAHDSLEGMMKNSGALLQYLTHNFETAVVGIGQELERYHKRMRMKYQGSNQADKEDNIEQMIKKMMGLKDVDDLFQSEGQKAPLYNDNCVLTDLLGNIVDTLPHYREHTVKKRGKSKVVKKLDEDAVRKIATELDYLSHPEYMGLIRDPSKFVGEIADILHNFYEIQSPLVSRCRGVVETAQQLQEVHALIDPEMLDKQMPNPEKAIQRMKRLDFLSIRPDEEEIEPRNKVERDYQRARQKLFHHLDTSMQELSRLMATSSLDDRLEIAEKAVRKAITLRDEMEDVIRTDYQKRLKADIRGDNEFYKGVTGQIGSFEAERAPTPTVKYKGVLGKSFDDAKEHIEEVVKIAAYPNMMEVTAPRGDIKSNLLLIGPYGCGKSELARAIGGDKRVIGLYVSVKDILTAYMHESVKNVGRVWDAAADLRKNSRDSKPVALIMDEFDAWFQQGKGHYGSADMQQIRTTLQETMDGVVAYPGVIMVAMTNEPKSIPDAILRRFKYVDVVGQLNLDERANMLRNFLKRGMAVSPGIKMSHYRAWASQGEMQYAPGDVIGKIADHVHFGLMRDYLSTNPKEAGKIERYLASIKRENEVLTDAQYSYVKRHLREYRPVTPEMVSNAVDHMLLQPPVQKMIVAARETYEAAAEIKAGLATIDPEERRIGFGAKVGKKGIY